MADGRIVEPEWPSRCHRNPNIATVALVRPDPTNGQVVTGNLTVKMKAMTCADDGDGQVGQVMNRESDWGEVEEPQRPWWPGCRATASSSRRGRPTRPDGVYSAARWRTDRRRTTTFYGIGACSVTVTNQPVTTYTATLNYLGSSVSSP